MNMRSTYYSRRSKRPCHQDGRANRNYRWVIGFVLLILVYVTAWHVIVWYKGRPPNRVHVYDLTWRDETDANNIVYRKWRYFLGPRSYLPLKVEKYSKRDLSDNYTLQEILVADYPDKCPLQ